MEHLMVEQWNRDVGPVQHLIVEQWNNHGGTVEQLLVEQWNILCWNSRRSGGGKVEQSW